MKTSIEKKKSAQLFFLWICSFPFLFGLTYIAKKIKIDYELILIFFGILTSLAVTLFVMFKKNICFTTIIQLFVVIFLLTLFWDSAALSPYTQISKWWLVIFGLVVFNSCTLILLYRIISAKSKIFIKIRYFIKKEWAVLLIILLFFTGSIVVIDAWLGAGAYDYYCYINYATKWDMSSLDILRVCGHDSHSFAFFMLMGQYIFGKSLYSARIIQLILACVTIECYNLILKKMLPKISKVVRVLLVACLAFSPLLYGMIAETNTDFFTLFFFVWMVAAALYNRRILEAVSALFLCFSKETGFVMYVFYMLGCVLHTLIIKGKYKGIQKVFHSVINKRVLLNCFAGWIYLSVFLLKEGSAWTGGVVAGTAERPFNIIGFDFEYITFKIKQFLSPNFLWIYTAVILIAILALIFRKLKKNKREELLNKTGFFSSGLLEVSMALVGYLGMNLFYITWTNYRYVIVYLIFINIFFAVGLFSLFKNKSLQTGVLSIVLILTFASNYITIDTLFSPSKYSYDIGKNALENQMMFYSGENSNMTTDEALEEFGTVSLVYNREYVYMGRAIEKALKGINYDKDTLILLPDRMGDYVTYTTYFGRREEEGNGPQTLYWNTKEGQLTVNSGFLSYENDTEYEKFNVNIASNKDDLHYYMNDSKYKQVYVIAFPFINETGIGYYELSKSVETYSYGLCNLNVYKMK